MADFSTIRKEDCRETPIPAGCRLGDSRTVVLQSVLNEIKEHGRSSMHEEVCGVLVGALCWDDGPYLLIDARIEGKHASHQSGSVTFTSETWTYIHEELAAKHDDHKIVGWYHTHPGFGIFLSNMDAFIHENFFSFPWQPAYVFDPQAETDGFFFLTDGNLVKEEVSVIADVKPIVKEPMLAPDAEDRIIIEERRHRAPRIGFFVAGALALVLAVAATSIFLLLRQARKEAREAEAQAMSLQEKLRAQEAEHRKHEAEWTVTRDTYEREIDGLRIKVTTITAEQTGAETENSANKAEIERLKAERAKQEKLIHDLETTLATRQTAERETAEELNSARGRAHDLQRRIEELEARNLELEAAANAVEPAQEETSPRQSSSESSTSSGESENHPWYWHLYPSWFD